MLPPGYTPRPDLLLISCDMETNYKGVVWQYLQIHIQLCVDTVDGQNPA